jgi:hypothetical protein
MLKSGKPVSDELQARVELLNHYSDSEFLDSESTPDSQSPEAIEFEIKHPIAYSPELGRDLVTFFDLQRQQESPMAMVAEAAVIGSATYRLMRMAVTNEKAAEPAIEAYMAVRFAMGMIPSVKEANNIASLKEIRLAGLDVLDGFAKAA